VLQYIPLRAPRRGRFRLAGNRHHNGLLTRVTARRKAPKLVPNRNKNMMMAACNWCFKSGSFRRNGGAR
jgi:hypothetical protein